MVNIKPIDHAAYQELLDQEGDTVPLYALAALHFAPPRPMTDKEAARRADTNADDWLPPYGQQEEYFYATVLLLNVDEPCYHKEYDGSMVFILPTDLGKVNYDMLSTMHPEHGAWAYRIEPRFWSAYNEDDDSPMDDAKWWFKDQKIKPFDLADKETH